MRLNITIFFLLFSFITTSFAQQWYNYQPTAGFDINTVAIPAMGRLAIGGGNEANDSIQIMFASGDYGQTWQENSHDGLGNWNKSIAFASATDGIGVGYNGRIIRSYDAGANWGYDTYPINRDFNKIVFAGGQTYFVAGGNRSNDSIQTILKTNNGGLNWTVMLDQPGPWLKSIYFTDTVNGLAVGDSGVVLSTVTGGAVWTSMPVPVHRDFNAIAFINADTGFIVGGDITHRTILRTNDGGTNWTIVLDATGGRFNDISFADSLIGYIGGDSATLLKTTDGGLNWAPVVVDVNLTGNEQISAVKFLNAGFGAIAGKAGLLYVFRLPLPYYTLTTQQATYVTYSSATFNGTIDSATVPMNLFFEYDTTTAFANSVPASPALINDSLLHDVSAVVNSLKPYTNYYCRVKAVAGIDTYYGNTVNFYTSVQSILGSFITQTATEVSDTTAVLNGTITGFYFPTPVQVSFQFGHTTALGNVINVGPVTLTDTLPYVVSAFVTGLSPDTSVYYYRLVVNTGTNLYYGNTRLLYKGISEVPNWDFKNWHTDNTLIPAGWYFSSDYFTRVPGYSGNYALQITGPTVAAKGGPMDPVVGGAPFSARPDSFSVFMKYAIEAGDTAFVWLHLQGAGQTVADKQYRITGNSGGVFKRMSFPVSYNSAAMPDTVALVFTSSNPFGETSDTLHMLSSVTIDDISFSATSANIPNHDLESWNTYTVERPDGWKWWTYFIDSSEFNSVPMVSKTMLSNPTDYALQIKNIVLGGALVDGALATYENLFKEGPDFPISHRYTSLNGYYEFFPENGDSIKVTVTLRKGKYSNDLAYGEIKFGSTVSSFTRFEIPINFMYNDTTTLPDPDWASISIGSGGRDNTSVHGYNTRLILDKLTFDASVPMAAVVTGVNEAETATGFTSDGIRVYPNPATDLVTIALTDVPAERGVVQLYNLSGQFIREIQLTTGQQSAAFSMAGLESGVYMLRVQSGQQVCNKKIALVR